MTELDKNIETENKNNSTEPINNIGNRNQHRRSVKTPKRYDKPKDKVETPDSDISNVQGNESTKSQNKKSQPQANRRNDKDHNSEAIDGKGKQQTKRNKPRKDYGNRPLISVVIPTYNEEGSLVELCKGLENVLSKEANGNYEVLFIDDGSTDKSFSIIKDINRKNNRFKAVRFRRNYGKSAALSIGFKRAKGAVIITMDADLQDDPTEIPSLMTKIRDGYDLVSGWKKKRNDPINKTLPSKFFNYVTAKASGLKLHDFNCGLKAYRAEVAHSLDIYGEMHRYLPVLAHWNGFRITEIPVKHHPRKHGETKFGASRYVKGFLDLITLLFTSRYMKRPLHLFGTIGTVIGLIGFFINAWLTVEWILGKTFLSNRPMTLFGIALIIVGVQLVSLGLLGELIVKNIKRDEEYQIRENL